MATLNIAKISGVLSTTVGSNPPMYYFGATGSYAPYDNLTGFNIIIRSGVNNPVNFQVALADLRVNGQTPSSYANALTLLNAIFGT